MWLLQSFARIHNDSKLLDACWPMLCSGSVEEAGGTVHCVLWAEVLQLLCLQRSAYTLR